MYYDEAFQLKTGCDRVKTKLNLVYRHSLSVVSLQPDHRPLQEIGRVSMDNVLDRLLSSVNSTVGGH